MTDSTPQIANCCACPLQEMGVCAGRSAEGAEEDSGAWRRSFWAGVPGETWHQVLRPQVPQQSPRRGDRPAGAALHNSFLRFLPACKAFSYLLVSMPFLLVCHNPAQDQANSRCNCSRVRLSVSQSACLSVWHVYSPVCLIGTSTHLWVCCRAIYQPHLHVSRKTTCYST